MRPFNEFTWDLTGRIAPHVALAAALAGAVGGCATTPPPVAATPVADTVLVVDTVTVEVETMVADESAAQALQQQVSQLELRLLERDAQIDDLQRRLDESIQEVVRTMAKLQSQATRAEAASGIAEAEIALEQLAQTGGRGSAEIEQARTLLAGSTDEFNKQNFGGSLYLANQARAIVRIVQGRLIGASRADEEQFAVPVPLRTTTRSNVRAGPGINFNVLFTLDQGAVLTGRAHTTEWIRIETVDGRTGWVFHSLVERPE